MFKGGIFLTKFCWKYNKKFLFGNLLLSIVNMVYPLLAVIVPSYIIDELLGQQRMDVIASLILLLCVGNFVGGWISIELSVYNMNQKNVLFNRFQLFLSDNLLRADLEQLESAEFLTTKEKAHKYLYGDGRGFASIFDDFTNVITQILTIITLSYIILQLNGIVLIALFVSIILSGVFDAKAQKAQVKINLDKADIERKTRYYSEVMEDHKVSKEVKIYNMADWIKNKYASCLEDSQKFYLQFFQVLGNNAKLKQVLQLAEQLILYFYIATEILKNTISVGSFTMYVSAVTNLVAAIKSVIQSYIRIMASESYFEETDKYLSLPSTIMNDSDTVIEDNEIYSIEFCNVSFKYPNQDSYVLQGVSFKIDSQEKVTIIGENGAGKTTLIKLLLRLYKPTEGHIYINGIDINEINYQDYMEKFGVVFQDFKFFAATIKENLTFDNVDEQHLETVLKQSGIYDKIETLPKGVDTNVYKIFDKEGIELSGGQMQKLALSKALYKDSPVMILDEPTSALDPRAEFELYQTFNNNINDKIAIYISHRLSSCRFCDKILVLDRGRIIQQGNHNQLIENDGLYSELFLMQANAYAS
ncbi:MAG: hypothetical protein ATN35_09770 [Epulopiscium sp. Nele67-Bin004]|nr:MAG: hypothetical protein ATN35_09770 [Epulopiscium sp. Nele67-Bin004]